MLGTLTGSFPGWTNLSTVGILVAAVSAYLMYRSIKRPHGFPPGPTCVPFIGNVLTFMKGSPYVTFKELTKEYGDVFSVKMASHWVVVLNNIDVVKEGLLYKQDQFTGRPPFYTTELLTEGYKDISMSSPSETWKIHRKLGHTAIRMFATGKKLEKLVFNITSKLDKVLEIKVNEPFDPVDTISLAVFNILASLCFGHEYEYDDPRLLQKFDLLKEQYKVIGSGLAPDFVPILRYFPLPEITKFKKFKDRYLAAYYEELKEHRQNYDPDNIRDVIDSLFKAQQEAIEEGSTKADSLTDTHLMMTVVDLFGAGTESTIATFHWAFALLTEHPEIQAKVAEECDRVIGRDRLPSVDDRGKVPYTEATLYEIFRYGSVAPMGVPHTTTEDVVLCGYNIPKGTWILVNHWGLHRDEMNWEKPFEFTPEHFLDESGQIQQHPNSYLPFSTGRRTCLGESLAKAEIFLLFCWLFQHYKFSKVPGEERDGSLLDLDRTTALIHQPKHFKLVCEKRF